MESLGLKNYSTYGFWDYFSFCQDTTVMFWEEISQTCDVSMGTSFLAFAIGFRVFLIPLGIYS